VQDLFTNVTSFLQKTNVEAPLVNLGFSFTLDGSPYIAINSAEGAKILLTNQEKYVKLPLSYEKLVSPLLGQGLITSEFHTWKPHRQTLSAHFSAINLNSRLSEFLSNISNILKESIRKKTATECSVFFKQVSLAVNWNLLLGTYMDDNKAKQWNLLLEKFNPVILGNKFLGIAAPLMPFVFPSFYQARDSMRQDLQNLITNREFNDSSILNVMLHSKAFTPKNIIDQCITFLFAGHDSTANCISW
jgi:cytochrome P450